MSQVASINDVSDDFLEKILSTLLIPEQITFAKVCQRFRNVFIKWSETHSKHYTFNPDFESERERQAYFHMAVPENFDWSGGGLIFTREDQRLYFELVGPNIETVHINLSVFALRIISTYCTNLKEIGVPLDLNYLVPLVDCRSLNSLHLIGNEEHAETAVLIENFVTCLTKLPNLTKVRIIKSHFQGEALSKLATLQELILIECSNLLQVNMVLCFEKMKNLRKLHLSPGLQYTTLFTAMARSCQHLTELSCYVSSSVNYEIISQLPRLTYLQIWSNDPVVRPNFFVNLVKDKGQQLQVLRIYNAQISIRDTYNIAKIATLKELKVILPEHVNNFRSLVPLRRLEYLQIYDYNDADNYKLFNVAETLPYFIKKCRTLRTVFICYCRDVKIGFIHALIEILSSTERLYEGPLRVFTYGTDIDQRILQDELYKASQHLIKVHYRSLIRPQVNSLSLMNNYF